MTEHRPISLLRSAPEPPAAAFTADEAIDAAKAAFTAARREQLKVLSCYLSQMIFDPRKVTYSRLKGLRSEARKQVELALKVERLINESIEALEATRPRGQR